MPRVTIAMKARFRLLACLLLLAVAMPAAADPRSLGEQGIAEYRKGNLIEGMQLLEEAATAGYLPAQTTLAYIFDAAEQDARAIHWYSQAASAGDAAGLFGLGGMYAKGERIARDARRAGDLIVEAASLGHVEAMRVYAHALEHGLLGLEPHDEGALTWYRRAAENGDKLSMNRLAKAYKNGELGLAVDTRLSSDWQQRVDIDD